MTPRFTPDEARKLLGGYATGTLTDPEREALMAAALEDQSLFDALAEEDSLRELLEAPGAKRRLLESIREQPSAAWFGLPWLTRGRAVSLGGLAAVAALTVAFLAQKPAVLPQRPGVVSEAAPAAKEAPAPVTAEDSRKRELAAVPPSSAKTVGGLAAGSGSGTKQPAPERASRERAAPERAKASEPAARRDEAPAVRAGAPAPPPPPAAPAASEPTPPKAAEPPARKETREIHVESSSQTVQVQAGGNQFRVSESSVEPSVQTQRQAPLPLIQRPRPQQDAVTARGAGAQRDAEKKALDSKQTDRVAFGGGVAQPQASAPARKPEPEPLTLRYKLDRGQGSDVPTELIVEASSGFVYILGRNGATWDTVASGNGPHTVADQGEFAIVASRVALENPASVLRNPPSSRDLVSSSGDGFTTISSPETSVTVTVRNRGR